MKRKILLALVFLVSFFTAHAQSVPVVEIRINNSVTSKDDYVGANYVPCTLRIFDGANLPDSIPVLLRNVAFNNGGQVLFSNKGGNDPGSETLNLYLKKDNSFLTFYIKGKPGFNSTIDKDAIIEVVDKDPTQNPIVVGRKGFMVIEKVPLVHCKPEVEIKINSESTLDDYISWAPTLCSIRLINYSSFAAPVSMTLRNMQNSIGKVNFSASNLQYGKTAKDTTLDLTLPNSGTWVNFYIAGRFNNPSVRDKDAIIEAYVKAGPAQRLVRRDTIIKTRENTIYTLDTIDLGETIISTIAVRDTTYEGPDMLVSLRDSIKSVKKKSIRVKTSLITVRDTSISIIDTLIAQLDTVLAREGLMVRIRKNANKLTAEERDRFLTAFATFNNTFNSYQTYVDIHNNAGRPEAHDGPAFLPWHRAFTLDLEREFQRIDPSVSLTYWKFDEPAPNLFSKDFIGAKPTSTAIAFAGFNATNPLSTWNIAGVNGIRRTTTYSDSGFPNANSIRNEVATLALGTNFSNFRAMESNPHGQVHTQSGRSGDWIPTLATAVRDPLFFLLHTNVDRQWAKWQWVNNRFDGTVTSSYSLLGTFDPSRGAHVGHFSRDTMWPWNGITGTYNGTGTIPLDQRPTTAPGGTLPAAISFSASPGDKPKVFNLIDYKNNREILTVNSGLGFGYDDVPFE